MASSEAGNASDELPTEQLAKKLVDMVDNAAVSIAVGMGSELGLFSVMSELSEPATSDLIAEKAGLIERYVREWLAIVVTGKIVTYSRESNTYFLPRNYIPLLTSGKHNISILNRMMLRLGESHGKVSECFKKGGGIPYTNYAWFHTWMSELSSKKHEVDLVSHFVPSVEGLKERMESGIKCLDVGCGSGMASILLAAAFPNSEFHGFDFSEEAIQRGNDEAKRRGLTNCHFKVQDCVSMGEDMTDAFDYITAFDSIHDQAYPDKVLGEIYRVLKKGGTFSMYDVNAHSNLADNVDVPLLPLKYTASLFHCMPVSLYFENGQGLGTCWGKELARQMLETAGFVQIEEVAMQENDFNMHIASRK